MSGEKPIVLSEAKKVMIAKECLEVLHCDYLINKFMDGHILAIQSDGMLWEPDERDRSVIEELKDESEHVYLVMKNDDATAYLYTSISERYVSDAVTIVETDGEVERYKVRAYVIYDDLVSEGSYETVDVLFDGMFVKLI